MKSHHAALAALVASGLAISGIAGASSHREAPFITENPKADGTDLYTFRSYETGRHDFVTILANYLPLQDPYGGPNYFSMDPDVVYSVHIDHNGDAREDLTFEFQFQPTLKGISLPVGPEGNQVSVPVPVINVGGIAAGQTGALNVEESYTVRMLGRRANDKPSKPLRVVGNLSNATDGATSFKKPVDNIGNKSIPNYTAYAEAHIYNINIPGSQTQGRLFVGQRKDPFVVNLGETFDLINIANPIGAPDAETDTLADKNVTTFALELPISVLVGNSGSDVIGVWTTASLPKTRTLSNKPTFSAPAKEKGKLQQVSRLGNPLVNELVIGLPDKNLFNASHPSQDGQFLTYVTNPTLPEIVEILFGGAGVKAPDLFPRQDLVAAFLTGVPGLTQTATPCEVLRLNITTPPVAAAQQNNLGVIGGDVAGFPNGRRPGDDVVDIALRVVMGKLITLGLYGTPDQAPSGDLPFTDGALVRATDFPEKFPYTGTPIPGSPE